MYRRLSLPLLAVLAGLLVLAAGANPLRAEPKLAELTGTVTGFDPDTAQLNVNTRLGPRFFRVVARTLILLNGRTTTSQNIDAGDDVTVVYDFSSSEADEVRLFREAQRGGVITAVTNTTLTLRTNSGALINLRPDASSVVDLAGIPLSDRAVLLNRRVSALYEPGSFLLLTLRGEARTMEARLASVDGEKRTVTLQGKPSRTLALDTAATIRRGTQVVELADLKRGDRLVLALSAAGKGRRVLALQARRKP